ncbi:hemoblobin-interacting domain-containing protein, partial [Agathobaculum hominis]
IQDSTVSGRLDYVVPTVSGNQQGSDAVLTFENGTDYLGKISALYLNGDWRELDEKYYSIEGNVITLSKDLLHVGENALKIVSNGYKTQTVEFTYGKVNEENLSLSEEVNKDAQTVTLTVNGSNGDFLKNLTSVKLGEDTVYAKGVEGSDAVYYVVAEDNKSLTLHNVKPGTYTVKIAAEYYDDALTKEFTMEKVDTPDTKTAPEISSYEQKSISDFYGTQYPVYRFSFNGLNATDLKGYLNAVTSVKVNKTTLTKNTSSFSFDEKEFRLYSTGSENGGAMYDYDRLDLFASLFKQPGTYTITLTAPDYADVSYELTVSGSTEPTEPTDPKPEPEKPNPDEGTVTIPTTAPTVTSTGSYSSKYILDFSDFKAWVGKIKSIKMNGTTLKSVDSSDNVSSDKYYLDAENGYIYMYLSIYSDQKIVISADGCDKLILTASSGSGWNDPPVISYTGTAPGGLADAPTVANIAENPSTMLTAAFCRVSFTDNVAEYLSNVTKVTLNGEKLQSGGIYDSSTKTFKVGTVSATGVKAYLDFSMDCFAEGTSTIVVTADDYKDLTFVVTNTDGVLSIR